MDCKKEELKVDAENDFVIIRTKQLLLNYKYKVIHFFFEVPTNPRKTSAMVATIENGYGDRFEYFLQSHEVLME